MKIYLASSFSLRAKVESVCKILEAHGYEVLVKWWTRYKLKEKFKVLSADDFYSEPECEYAFNRDLQGIKDCDALVFVASEIMRPYCGASVEIGMAFALDKPVYSIGIFQNSAMYFNICRCTCLNELLIALRSQSNHKRDND